MTVIGGEIYIPFALEEMQFRRSYLAGMMGISGWRPNAFPLIGPNPFQTRRSIHPNASCPRLAKKIIRAPANNPGILAVSNHRIFEFIGLSSAVRFNGNA
jgi:hypothetical protein